MPVSVAIRLLDISSHLQGDDEERNKCLVLNQILDDLFCQSTACYSAREYLSLLVSRQENRSRQYLTQSASDTADISNDRNNDVRHQLRTEITKFIQVNDRYMGLASMLLKNEAFFKTLSPPPPDDERRLILVSLPRTEYRKPYIPTTTTTCDGSSNTKRLMNDDNEINTFSISLSHQWPFAGLIRIIRDDVMLLPAVPAVDLNKSRQRRQQQQVVVGLDIVVFEKINRRLYDTAEEFVDVFRDYFAPSEWKTIQQQRDNTTAATAFLGEFYLQWSVKEAYTKALGVGLGFDFSGFQVQWDTPVKSLWDVVSSLPTTDDSNWNGGVVYRELSGTIVFVRANNNVVKKPGQRWVFVFLPLRIRTTNEENTIGELIGAGCACVGPFTGPDRSENESVDWNIEWVELASMLS